MSRGVVVVLLSDGTIYKHTKNASGYSPKTDYISTTTTSPHASSFAVDGYVYVTSDAGLQRLIGPALQKTTPYPQGLSDITNLRSINDGDNVLGLSKKAGRIIIWNTTGNQVILSQQISLSAKGTITDAIYDAKTGKIFATVDNHLVSFPFKP